MKKLIVFILVAMFLPSINQLNAFVSPEKQNENEQKIGTYDSRIIYAAFPPVNEFRKNLQEMNTILQATKFSGDKIQIFGLEKSKAKSQEILQKEIFSINYH